MLNENNNSRRKNLKHTNNNQTNKTRDKNGQSMKAKQLSPRISKVNPFVDFSNNTANANMETSAKTFMKRPTLVMIQTPLPLNSIIV